MATKPKPTTAVALKKPSGNIVSIQEQLKANHILEAHFVE